MEKSTEKMQRKLFIKPYDRMVKDLVKDIQDGMIILDPDYQRNYVWNNTKASLLIESILLNIPIPVIYASENEEGKWIIVDGLQRLYSLQRFFEMQFKLTGLETLEELNGLKYNTINDMVRNRLDRGELRIIVLQNDSDPNIQFDIFMRLNTGAVKLNEQELRNCLYRGKLNNLIKKIAKEDGILKKLISVKTDRMLTNELILRYLAVSEHFDKEKNRIQNYDGRIKNLINSYMDQHKNDEDESLISIQKKVETQLEKAYEVFGELAFKKNDKTTKPNAALFECIMLSFEDFSLENLKSKKEDIKDLLHSLLSDYDFVKSIDKATGNTEVINLRLSMFRTQLGALMNDAG